MTEDAIPSSPPIPFPIKDFSKAINSLPSCQRCRNGRRRCDTLLPSCSRCRKAGKECLFYDHALQQVLPRSYISSLLKTAESLQQQLADAHLSRQQFSIPNSVLAENAIPMDGVEPSRPATPAKTSRPGGFHFPVTTIEGPTFRYFGTSSVFSLASHILAHRKGDLISDGATLGTSTRGTAMEPADFHGTCNCTITKSMVQQSVEKYMCSVNILHPFLDKETIATDFESYWHVESNHVDPRALRGLEAHQFFRIKIIVAITSANRSRHNVSRTACDHACFLEASKCIAEVTSEVSQNSLIALLLLIVYCLFRPRKGDIWKLLDYACRLCLELGYQAKDESSDPRVDRERRTIFWSLYSLEKTVSQLFGRPSNFPDAIVAADFPETDNIPMVTDNDEKTRLQLITEYYKLVSLQSSLSKEFSQPEALATQSLSHCQVPIQLVETWLNEANMFFTTNMKNSRIGLLKCTITFHETVLYIFQPLIVDSLNQLRNKDSLRSNTLSLPQELFLSAVRLVEAYSEVIEASREAELGMYPLDILSAQQMFQAAMIVMAYCLFYLDDKVAFQRMISHPRYTQETAHIDLDNICQISNSCLILLSFCKERWPGLVGMRDLYRQLSNHILKDVLRKQFTGKTGERVAD